MFVSIVLPFPPSFLRAFFFFNLLLAVEKSDTFAFLIIALFVVVFGLFFFFFPSSSLIWQLCKVLLNQFAQPFGSVGGKPVLKGAIWLQLQVKCWVSSGREVGRTSDRRWGKSCSSPLRGS